MEINRGADQDVQGVTGYWHSADGYDWKYMWRMPLAGWRCEHVCVEKDWLREEWVTVASLPPPS